MKYLIDTAVQSEIEKWKNHMEGVTSNPSLLKKANTSSGDFFIKNKNNFDNIFIQVRSIDEVKEFYNHDKIIFKVPLLITKDLDGFDLITKLKKAGYRTCATITYDLFQFDYACKIGSDYSIVLCAKNTNKTFLSDCVYLKETMKYKTKIIAASFRSMPDIQEAIYAGADFATIPPKYMEGLFTNQDAITDYNKFYGIE